MEDAPQKGNLTPKALYGWLIGIAGRVFGTQQAAPITIDENGILFSAPLPLGADRCDFTLVPGSTSNYQTATFKKSGTTVGTCTFVYNGDGTSADDVIVSVQWSF